MDKELSIHHVAARLMGRHARKLAFKLRAGECEPNEERMYSEICARLIEANKAGKLRNLGEGI